MIRVIPTKLQLKADDLQEYERHKELWKLKEEKDIENKSKINSQQEKNESHRTTVGARLGITKSK